MNPTSPREQALKQLQAQIEGLPPDHPRKALLVELLAGNPSPEAQKAQKEALRRIALERFNALSDGDPLKGVLGKMLTRANDQTAAPTGPVTHADVQHDIWTVVDALKQRDEMLFKGIQTVDARSAAAMAETQRLAAKSVELQELLNMVMEELHANTAMLKNLKEALPKP